MLIILVLIMKVTENEPEDLLNSRGNLDTLLLVHDVTSLPAW